MSVRDLNMNDLFVLYCLEQDKSDLYDLYVEDKKKMFELKASEQKLSRLRLITTDPKDDERYIISIKGREFLSTINNEDNTAIEVRPINDVDRFEEWWKAFPATDNWKDDSGKEFSGDRNLRSKKQECKKKYLTLLNQGIEHTDLLGALKYEIKLKKVNSIKTNMNKLSFFKSTESYLNSKTFDSFIDLYQANPAYVSENTILKTKQNVTDV